MEEYWTRGCWNTYWSRPTCNRQNTGLLEYVTKPVWETIQWTLIIQILLTQRLQALGWKGGLVRRPYNISVNILSHGVEKILVTKIMLKPPTTLVPKFARIEQLSNHVCHDIGISYSFANNQGFSPISPLKTANFRWSETESPIIELKNNRYPFRGIKRTGNHQKRLDDGFSMV